MSHGGPHVQAPKDMQDDFESKAGIVKSDSG